MRILILGLLISFSAIAQQPSCNWNKDPAFTAAGAGPSHPNNTPNPICNAFSLNWSTTGFSAISIQIEGSDDGSIWFGFTGASTVLVGTNPSTALSGTIKIAPASRTAFIRVHLVTATGAGSVSYQLFGYSGTSASLGTTSGASACASLGGDVTGSCAANTVVKIQNGAIPLSAPAIGTNGIGQPVASSLSSADSSIKLASFKGASTPTDGNCASWSSGDVQDAGTPCGVVPTPIFTAGGTVTPGTLVCISSSATNTVVECPTTQGTGAPTVLGIAQNSATVGNPVAVATNGGVNRNCVFDNTAVIGDIVTTSITIAGNCTDSGVTTPAQLSLTAPYVGIVQTAGAGSQAVMFVGNGANGALPASPGTGATSAVNGSLAYDTTANNLHAAQAGADAKVAQYTVAPTNGNCVEWLVVSGKIDLGDAGSACGSGSGGGGVITYSASVLALTGTQFIPVGGGGAVSTTEVNVQTKAPSSATVSNLQVVVSVAPGVGNSFAFTWRDGASDQTLTCTISGTATSCADTTHSFTVAAGDLIDIKIITTGVTGATNVNLMTAFGTSGVGVTSVTATSPLISSGGTTPNLTATYQGNGAKIQASTGGTTTNNCVKFDANGNTVDAGAPCGTGSGAMVLIQEQVLSSPASSITFSSIPSSFRNLTLTIQARCSDAAAYQDTHFQLNGDTGSNYTFQGYNVQGAAFNAFRNSPSTFIVVGGTPCAGAPANTSGSIQLLINNYSSTTFSKTVISENAAFAGATIGTFFQQYLVGVWNSTSAVSTVGLSPAAGNYVTGSVFSLYGF